MLFNKNLYLTAYGKLYCNQGAMTKGPDNETVDGMSLAKIDRIIAVVRAERYRWKPVRRVLIPKPNGKQRRLGLPMPGSYCISLQAHFACRWGGCGRPPLLYI